ARARRRLRADRPAPSPAEAVRGHAMEHAAGAGDHARAAAGGGPALGRIAGTARHRRAGRPRPSRRPRLDVSLADDLHTALREMRSPWSEAPLEPLPDLGLAHAHVRLAGSGVLARIPKQSQMGLAAADNLAYQAACFERAAASGHAPRLHGV